LKSYYSTIMASERIQRQIDRLLDEAEDAVTQGDWAVVSDRAGKVLALSPENQDTLTYLAAEQVLGVGQPGFLEPVAEPVGVRFVVVLVPLVVGVEDILEARLPEFLSQTFEGVSVLDVRPQLKRIQVQSP